MTDPGGPQIRAEQAARLRMQREALLDVAADLARHAAAIEEQEDEA
jgi:hypothetical protein